MLHDFIDTHREELISRCRLRLSSRVEPKATLTEIEHGIPLFLEQLARALRVESNSRSLKDRAGLTGLRPDSPDSNVATAEIAVSAMQHGQELAERGFTIDQVVHDYGDVCQAVTQLACETGTAIEVAEFKMLNLCLDDAIAGAVTEFSTHRESAHASQHLQMADEKTRVLLHQLLSDLETATLALTAINAGNVGLKGATGTILDLALVSIRKGIERSLSEAKGTTGLLTRH